MDDIKEITNLPRGATFFRADLHIHSCVGPHDVTDPTATPEAIVSTASREGLQLIAIADHNEIAGVGTALSAAASANILVVPAVELSTPQGHLLCYLPSLEALQRFHAQLEIVDRGTPNSRCQNSMLDCLTKVRAAGGWGVLAHVDAGGGLETQNPGASPHKQDVLCHPGLLAIELKGANSAISYSDVDPDASRAAIGQERIRRLGLGSRQYLARVLNSDAHTLNALGRNAAGVRKVTRYKMQALTFESLRIALDDSDARVRIEDEIPPAVPFVRGVRLAGGFLDGQAVHFSPNLNCIIGGRGTGKSTTFEAIRLLTGQEGVASVVDSDVWPNQIDLLMQDQANQLHHLVRVRDSDLENADDPSYGPVIFPLECYGQGETQQLSERAKTDPGALLQYLDRFVDVRGDLAKEAELRRTLTDLQEEIANATCQVELIPQYERDLALARSQLATLERAKAKEIIALQRSIEQERQARVLILQNADAISSSVPQNDIRTAMEALKNAADPSLLVVGAAEFSKITAQASMFEKDLASAETTLQSAAAQLLATVRAQTAAWKAKEADIVRDIDVKKRALEAKGFRVDLAYIQKLTAQEALLHQSLTNLKAWQPHLQNLQTRRKNFVKQRWLSRGRIAMKRAAFARKANTALRAALSDLQVTLRFGENQHSPEAHDIIVEAMGWRTQQVPRANWLTRDLTVPKLLDVVETQDPQPLLQLKTWEDVQVFNKSDATLILGRLSPDSVRRRLETCEVTDLPRLSITTYSVDREGERRYHTREFYQLSLGQQQSVLLALMLSSDNEHPLVIDQPEDNLDSAFIYQTLVPVLRRAKERRQVIIVTHNANIAVLGDAEQIVVLDSNNERASITSRGSIDDLGTREKACTILEGSREAFQRRARIYGVPASR